MYPPLSRQSAQESKAAEVQLSHNAGAQDATQDNKAPDKEVTGAGVGGLGSLPQLKLRAHTQLPRQPHQQPGPDDTEAFSCDTWCLTATQIALQPWKLSHHVSATLVKFFMWMENSGSVCSYPRQHMSVYRHLIYADVYVSCRTHF